MYFAARILKECVELRCRTHWAWDVCTAMEGWVYEHSRCTPRSSRKSSPTRNELGSRDRCEERSRTNVLLLRKTQPPRPVRTLKQASARLVSCRGCVSSIQSTSAPGTTTTTLSTLELTQTETATSTRRSPSGHKPNTKTTSATTFTMVRNPQPQKHETNTSSSQNTPT